MIYDKPQAITFPFFHLNPDKNLGSSSLERKNRISFETLLRNSGLFDLSHRFSTLNNRIHVVGNSSTKVDEIVKHANETHPMIHGKVQKIIVQFLEEKRVNGTKIEKEVYKTITPLQFVDRLLKMRPLVFMTKLDHFLLRDCSIGDGGFEKIGTDQEKFPLTLENCISYDEMQISALIDVSVPTHFINNGWRNNRGESGIKDLLKKKGFA